jgi:Antibiotic biosynthesis monooxygenase
MFVLHIELKVKPGLQHTLEKTYLERFRAAISAQEGFSAVQLLRSTSNDENYRHRSKNGWRQICIRKYGPRLRTSAQISPYKATATYRKTNPSHHQQVRFRNQRPAHSSTINE